jgi:hypothetical protein
VSQSNNKLINFQSKDEKSMTINIKLMADYFSYPLWGLDNDNIGDINPHELPLSEETIAKLEQWSQIYNNILNCDDPASSSFKTIEDQANNRKLINGQEAINQLKTKYNQSR